MTNIAMRLVVSGWVLRSGNGKRPKDAPGDTDSADLAFERGVDIIDRARKVIRCAGGTKADFELAAKYHPNWDACSGHAKALHARNGVIMLGDWLDVPVRFVVCWTPDGKVVGGTGQALRIAAAYNIPVFNLAVTPEAALWEFLG